MKIYDVFHEFQTLIAATFAFTAALIAYGGAMAKLSFDRIEADKRRAGEKLALLLKLRSGVNHLTYNLDHIAVVMSRKQSTENNERVLEKVLGERDFKAPKEVEEAWQRLDLLSQHQMNDLEFIRTMTSALRKQVFLGVADSSGAIASAKAIIFACGHLSDLLLNEIEVMRPGSAENSVEHAFVALMKNPDSSIGRPNNDPA